MIANSLITFGVLALLPSAIADLTCTQYFPQGKTSNVGVLQFTGQGAEDYVPTTNAFAANPVILNTNNPSGTTLKFESCTSSSLGFAPYHVDNDDSCSDAGCERDFYSFIRVINPTSGHCLATKPAANGYTKVYFQTCNLNPTTTTQIFQAFQTVEEGYNYQGPAHEYYPAYISPYGYDIPFNPAWSGLSAWVVGNDTKTLLYTPPSVGVVEDSLAAVILTQH